MHFFLFRHKTSDLRLFVVSAADKKHQRNVRPPVNELVALQRDLVSAVRDLVAVQTARHATEQERLAVEREQLALKREEMAYRRYALGIDSVSVVEKVTSLTTMTLSDSLFISMNIYL